MHHSVCFHSRRGYCIDITMATNVTTYKHISCGWKKNKQLTSDMCSWEADDWNALSQLHNSIKVQSLLKVRTQIQAIESDEMDEEWQRRPGHTAVWSMAGWQQADFIHRKATSWAGLLLQPFTPCIYMMQFSGKFYTSHVYSHTRKGQLNSRTRLAAGVWLVDLPTTNRTPE